MAAGTFGAHAAAMIQAAATNGQRPTANDQRPPTNDQRPTTNDQRLNARLSFFYFARGPTPAPDALRGVNRLRVTFNGRGHLRCTRGRDDSSSGDQRPRCWESVFIGASRASRP